MKKWWIIALLFVILISSVNAFSKEQGLKWLNKSIDFSSASIEESSFSLLALSSNNLMNKNSPGAVIFQQRKDLDDDCFPRDNCNVKDTALAALADKTLGVDNLELLDWLESTITKANVEDWYIQIHTTETGKCTIVFDEDQTKIVEVDGLNKLKIEGQSGEYNWINLGLLGANLDNHIEKVIVDCTKPTESRIDDPSMVISLLRISNNEFYLYQQNTGRTVELEVNNACYPSSLNGDCNKDASLYAAWVLKKLNKDITVLPYLEKNAANNRDYALLLAISGNERYAQLLIDSQSTSGYWDNQDIITTSFAVNALKSFSSYNDEIKKAEDWLKLKQVTSNVENNGSYGNILNTASALYLVFTQGTSVSTDDGGGFEGEFCGNDIVEGTEQCDGSSDSLCPDQCSLSCSCDTQTCFSDFDCDNSSQVCDQGSCILKCTSDQDCPNPSDQQCITSTGKCELRETECDNDGFCDFGETSLNCSSDCSSFECSSDSQCSSGEICNLNNNQCEQKTLLECNSDSECSEGETCNLETNQCEEKKGLGTLFWASLVIIVAILAVGGYLAYSKFMKKSKTDNKPNFFGSEKISPIKPKINYSGTRSTPSRKGRTDELLEKELDKSIKEAERLLKK
ncbi:MAG: hypothetical protein AABW56_05050 [Nanoarchaeota archaeon]